MTCSEFLAELDDLIDNSVTPTLRADLELHLREGCAEGGEQFVAPADAIGPGRIVLGRGEVGAIDHL